MCSKRISLNQIQDLKLENARMKNDLVRLQRAIAEGAVSFDLKGTKTKIAASQLMGEYHPPSSSLVFCRASMFSILSCFPPFSLFPLMMLLSGSHFAYPIVFFRLVFSPII